MLPNAYWGSASGLEEALATLPAMDTFSAIRLVKYFEAIVANL